MITPPPTEEVRIVTENNFHFELELEFQEPKEPDNVTPNSSMYNIVQGTAATQGPTAGATLAAYYLK